MGIFDKIFGINSDNPDSSDITMGILMNDPKESISIDPEISTIFNEHETTYIGQYRDPSKSIERKVWDGLTDEARKSLEEKGFYPEDGRIIRDDRIITIE